MNKQFVWGNQAQRQRRNARRGDMAVYEVILGHSARTPHRTLLYEDEAKRLGLMAEARRVEPRRHGGLIG